MGRPAKPSSSRPSTGPWNWGLISRDTSDAYGPFTNEELVGKPIRGRRDEVRVATKFGFVRDSDKSWQGIDGWPEHVREACDGSLRRLGIDQIDMYYQHRVDPKVPIAETLGAMAELVRQGSPGAGRGQRSGTSRRRPWWHSGLCPRSCWSARRTNATYAPTTGLPEASSVTVPWIRTPRGKTMSRDCSRAPLGHSRRLRATK